MPRFHLPGPIDAGGFLIFDKIRTGNHPLAVKLDGRHVRFLKVLAAHWRDSPDDLLGGPPFVTAKQIAEEFYAADEMAFAPDEETMRAYAAQINTLIREATPPGRKPPKVHESARLLGYRLVEELNFP